MINAVDMRSNADDLEDAITNEAEEIVAQLICGLT
jgi:hypothetical protein